MGKPIYKILTAEAFAEAKAKGRFDGAPVDLADGYIHFSAGRQVAGTLAKHFAGQSGLVLVAVDADALGDGLKWEVSRGGELFPHLYGPLDLAHMLSAELLVLDGSGQHRLPPGIEP